MHFLSVLVAVVVSTFPSAAMAYIGPGAGISAIGTLVALLAVILLAIVGFIWYPVKRILKKRKITPTVNKDVKEASDEYLD